MTTITRTLGPELHRVRHGYWRVIAPSGVVLGYVEEFESDGVPRFRARRLLGAARLVEFGEFWVRADAVEALR
jgi:hypothetical protein